MTIAEAFSRITAKTTPKKTLPKTAGPLTEDPAEEQEDESQARRDDRHRFLIVWFRRLREDVEHRVEQLTEKLASGEIDSQEWAAAFRSELTKAHAEGYSIGRRLAGFVGPFEEDDLQGGLEAWAEQEEFFQGFLDDVESGRYTKGRSLLEAQVNARGKQYAAALRGTANRSFKTALGQDLLRWALGEGDHCKPSKDFPYDCPSLAAEEPKPADQWETEPGGGKTPCRNFCTCHFESEDGKYSTEGI